MKIQITAGGIYDGKGVEVPIGSEFTVESEPTGWAGRYTVLSGDSAGKKGVTNPKGGKAGKPDPLTYKAEERDGAWVVVDSEGETHGNPLSAEDATSFNGLSDDEKAELLKAD